MSPIIFMKNELNIRSCDSKLFSELTGGSNHWVYISNLKNLFLRKLRSTVFRAFCFILTIFSNHVRHVVLIGADKKMLRSHTKSIITFMTNKFTFRYSSKMKNPGNSMRSFGLFIEHKAPIARIFNKGGPVPALWSFYNFIPKSFQSISDIKIMGVCQLGFI